MIQCLILSTHESQEKDAELEALGIDVLERHITTLLELAKTLSLPIGAIYREVVSGDSIDTRPVMTQVLSEVEACMWDGALVMDVDRLARGDTIDQGRVQRAFFYSNTRIVTPSKPTILQMSMTMNTLSSVYL